MVEQSKTWRIVCVGGGHCNCQVLKLLKQEIKAHGLNAQVTLVNESPKSYYSGMLPGTVASKFVIPCA